MSIKIKAVLDELPADPTLQEYEYAIAEIETYNNDVLELMKHWAEFYPLMAEKGGSS